MNALARSVQRWGFTTTVLASLTFAAYLQGRGIRWLTQSALLADAQTLAQGYSKDDPAPIIRETSAERILRRNPFDSQRGDLTLLGECHALLPALSCPGEEPIHRIGVNEYNVRRSFLDRLFEGSSLFRPLRPPRVLQPVAGDDGVVVGLRLAGLPPGSVWERFGLKNGDRLETLNGASLMDLQRSLEAFARLRTADEARLVINRGGRAMTLTYHLR